MNMVLKSIVYIYLGIIYYNVANCMTVNTIMNFKIPNGIPSSNAIFRKNDCLTVSAVGTIIEPSSSFAVDICSLVDWSAQEHHNPGFVGSSV